MKLSETLTEDMREKHFSCTNASPADVIMTQIYFERVRDGSLETILEPSLTFIGLALLWGPVCSSIIFGFMNFAGSDTKLSFSISFLHVDVYFWEGGTEWQSVPGQKAWSTCDSVSERNSQSSQKTVLKLLIGIMHVYSLCTSFFLWLQRRATWSVWDKSVKKKMFTSSSFFLISACTSSSSSWPSSGLILSPSLSMRTPKMANRAVDT